MSTAPAFDPRQLALDIAEPYHYHGGDEAAFLALLARQPSGGMRQKAFRAYQLPQVLAGLPRDRDSYLSQAEFIEGNRRSVNLKRLPLLFADLDPPKGQTIPPDTWRHRVLMFCDDEGLPPPSLIVYSGRGVHLKWLLEQALPSAALPRWNLAQRLIGERLEPLGADPNARDASRVLRLEQTVNSKTGKRCEVIWSTDGGAGAPVRYPFDPLFDELAPLTRDRLEALREERQRDDPDEEAAEGKPARWNDRPALELVKGGRHGLRKIDYAELAYHRYQDIRALAAARAARDGDLEGQRMLFLFWALNFLALSCTVSPANFWNEAQALARVIAPGWRYDRGELRTVFDKTRAFVRGEVVEFQGRKVPPLYTPRNATLIDRLAITPEEERWLRTVISKDEARRRDAERKRVKRRQAGAVERGEYLENMASMSAQRREAVLALRAEGKTNAEIGAELGIHPKSVSRILRG